MSAPRDANWIAARARAIGMFLGDAFEKVVHETVALLTSVMHSDLASFEAHLIDIKERQEKIDSGIAALLLEALSNKQIQAATGVPKTTICNRLAAMSQRCGARNRVGLALALQREATASG